LKFGTKSKAIRLVDGDQEISCKMDGIAIGLKSCNVKKLAQRMLGNMGVVGGFG